MIFRKPIPAIVVGPTPTADPRDPDSKPLLRMGASVHITEIHSTRLTVTIAELPIRPFPIEAFSIEEDKALVSPADLQHVQEALRELRFGRARALALQRRHRRPKSTNGSKAPKPAEPRRTPINPAVLRFMDWQRRKDDGDFAQS